MKAIIVKFLCRVGLIKIAKIISPSIAAYYMCQRAIIKTADSFSALAAGMQGIAAGLNKYLNECKGNEVNNE